MKLNAWLLSALVPLTALSVLAQTPNPVPPAAVPPPAVSSAPADEPAAKPAKEHKPKKPKTKAKAVKASAVKKNGSIVLNPPVTATVKCDVLEVRGQGSFTGEVIGKLKKGESATVLEEITLGHVRPSEPDQWSRIVMPASISVWVSADLIDPATKEVRVKKINVRGGPGENYSVVGGLDKGTVVKEVGKKEGWLQIETPTNAYAFVASEYLEKPATEPAAPVVAATPPPVATPPVVVAVPAEPAPPAPAKPAETAPVGLAAPAPTAASQADQELAALHRATAPEPAVTPPAAESNAANAQTPRVVTREGYVHRSFNIQTPTDFELHDIKTGELTEYVQPGPGQKFKAYVGTRVRITGSESLDQRWMRTPILKVQTVDLMP